MFNLFLILLYRDLDIPFCNSSKDEGRGRFHSEKLRKKFLNLSLRMYKANLLKIGVLKIDSSIVSVHYHLVYKGTEYGYLKGMNVNYSRFSPGNLLHYFMFQDAIRNGSLLIDFLRGSEPYKYEWTNKESQLYTAFTSRNNLHALFWKTNKQIMNIIYNSKTIKKAYFLANAIIVNLNL